MKKLFAILAALILCTSLMPATALDAVSSATVSIESFPELKEHENAKTLVIYFSTNDTVKAVALAAADALEADVFEIVPEQPYTAADLRWTNPLARCNREHLTGKDVPVAGKVEDFGQYDTVFIGFPIWWGEIPNIVYTFMEAYDFAGKTVVPFNTHEGSGQSHSQRDIERLLTDAIVLKGLAVRGSKAQTDEAGTGADITKWLNGLDYRH